VSAPPPRASHSVGGLPASAIPPERVREIQDALKREGYLQNEPSGQYDRATVEAMTNYQKDHNFRTTGYPTAESLQKLGLTRQRRVNPPAAPDSVKSEDNSSAPDTQTPHDPGN
jgi:peptidoglycan hydrolase-like protein with peptidoglycan-binding domain